MIEFLLGPNGIIVRYIISGGSGAVVDLSFLYILTEYVGFHYTISVVIAFFAAFIVSFAMQKYWTFVDSNVDRSKRQATAFLGVQSFNLFLNSFLVYLFTEKLGLWYMLSQFIAGALIAVSSFLIYRNFIFPRAGETDMATQ